MTSRLSESGRVTRVDLPPTDGKFVSKLFVCKMHSVRVNVIRTRRIEMYVCMFSVFVEWFYIYTDKQMYTRIVDMHTDYKCGLRTDCQAVHTAWQYIDRLQTYTRCVSSNTLFRRLLCSFKGL